jgi:ArsR family transcriptional regulator, arsenate/arsenite/antimonite-responsive transcriptional repressor
LLGVAIASTPKHDPGTAGGCRPLSVGPLPAAEASELATRLRAVADPARLRILSLIGAQPEAEVCVCHLTGPLGLGQPTVSHHLRVLSEAGLVEGEQRGRWVHYRLVPGALAELRGALG